MTGGHDKTLSSYLALQQVLFDFNRSLGTSLEAILSPSFQPSASHLHLYSILYCVLLYSFNRYSFGKEFHTVTNLRLHSCSGAFHLS